MPIPFTSPLFTSARMLVTCPDSMKPRTLRCALGDVTLQPGPNEVTADRSLMFRLAEGEHFGSWTLTELP